MRLRPGLALVSVVGVALAATAALGGTSRARATETYRVVFQGSGRATSTYPPLPSGTAFTSTISWTLVYQVEVSPEVDSSWTPQGGSSITGSSDGVATASGAPIEPGCEHIGFAVDATQQGGEFDGAIRNGVRLRLSAPGFDGGALVVYSPGQCSNPFPTDCPDRLGAQAVDLDTTKAQQSWQLSADCAVSAEGQTASWSGTVTATRVTAAAGGGSGGGSSGACVLADIALFAVAADARDDAWAAGGCNEQGAVEHWDGNAWAPVPLPAQATNVWRLDGIDAVSPRDVWAVGTGQGKHGSEMGIVLHWDGTRWTSVTGRIPRYISSGGATWDAVAATGAGAWVAGAVPYPRGLVAHSSGSTLVATLDRATAKNVQSGFTGVAVVSPRDVWVVGASNEQSGSALAEHWNGRSWREVRTPVGGLEFTGAAAAGGTVWAVGSGGYTAGAVENWTGVHWAVEAKTAVPLAAVSASSATNVWAVGWSARKGGLVEHWDGRTWSAEKHADLELSGVATTSADDVWAVAGATILHWDGHSWTSVQSG